MFLMATKSRTAPLAPGRGEGSGVRGKRTSPMPLPQPCCSFRCWCQVSRRRQSAGARAAECGSLCASSLRCTRALPYPARQLAIFFVARAFQPERRAAIFSPAGVRFPGCLAPSPPTPLPLRGRGEDFVDVFFGVFRVFRGRPSVPLVHPRRKTPPDPCAESQLPDCQLPAA